MISDAERQLVHQVVVGGEKTADFWALAPKLKAVVLAIRLAACFGKLKFASDGAILQHLEQLQKQDSETMLRSYFADMLYFDLCVRGPQGGWVICVPRCFEQLVADQSVWQPRVSIVPVPPETFKPGFLATIIALCRRGVS